MILHYSVIATPFPIPAAHALADRFFGEVYVGDRDAYIRALKNSVGSWHVLFNADAVPVPDFEQLIAGALKHAPGPVVTFAGGVGTDASFMRTTGALDCRAFAIFSRYARALAEELEANPVPLGDAILGWLVRYNGANFATLPPLVDAPPPGHVEWSERVVDGDATDATTDPAT